MPVHYMTIRVTCIQFGAPHNACALLGVRTIEPSESGSSWHGWAAVVVLSCPEAWLILLLPCSRVCCFLVRVCVVFASRAGSLTHCHVDSTALHGFFQPNQRPGSGSDNQNQSIGGAFMSIQLTDIFFRATNFKSLFLGFSNKNTSLKKFVYFCCPALYCTQRRGTAM